MPVAIGEVHLDADVAQDKLPPTSGPAAAPPPAPRRLDPDEIRLLLRRDEQRRERLWVD